MKKSVNQSSLVAPGSQKTKETSVVAQVDRTGNLNEEVQSEYSEAISIASFSDEDAELVEIERRDYPPGMEGKEQAYRDIERVFDELEDDKLLDPFTRWKPKEDLPDTKKRSKFVPKRPAALPRRLPSTQSHEVVATTTKPSKTLTKTGTEKNTKTTDRLQATDNAVKKTSMPTINITNPGIRKKSSLMVSPRKSIVAELIMQANDEEAHRKKLEEERLAKEQVENLTKLRSNMGSGATTTISEERPQTQSSGITEFDESDSQADEDSRPQTRSGSSRPLSRDNTVVTIDEIQKYSAGTFLNEKQRLCKDEYIRKGQVEMRRDLKTIHTLSPLVTNEELSTVETGPKGTTITTVGHKTQYELKVAASNAITTPQQNQLTRQEELILELAESKGTKKKSKKEIPFLESSHNASSSKKREEPDKSVFKIAYKEPRWPHQVTLDRMVDRLFSVKHLILDDSQLKSLRDITSLLPSLIILSVKNCGLKTLDGALAFPNLQKLLASDNQLTQATQCALLPELQELDLSGNPIESLDGFRYLGVLNFLRIIRLYDTKVSEIRYFHMELRRLVPSLRDIFPKSTTGGLYDFDIDDDDYLEVDTKLLGDKNFLNQKKPDRTGQKDQATVSTASGSGATIRPKIASRKLIGRQGASATSESELKLQSLIATLGDSETEGDLEKIRKDEIKLMEQLEKNGLVQERELNPNDGGTGDAIKDEMETAKEAEVDFNLLDAELTEHPS